MDPDSVEVNKSGDVQLEDVEDYTSDYPPDYPMAESEERRRGLFGGLVLANKKVTGLLVCVFVLAIVIIALLVAGGEDDNDVVGYHQPLILIDPSTLDPAVTEPLMKTLKAMYDKENYNAAALDQAAGDDTPQRRAFFWLAHDNQQQLSYEARMIRYCLALFYYSTNMVPTPYEDEPLTWYLARRWLTKAHVCDWYGIECDDDKNVVSIEMERNFLSGKIPEELNYLEDYLESMDFSSNGIHMEEDDFNVFTSLPWLSELIMDDNYLEHHSGLPLQLGELTGLTKLTMSFNLFEGELDLEQKEVIDKFQYLQHLELESNYFSGSIPGHIGRKPQLIYLYMRRNNMNTTLDFLHAGQMKNLFALWLDGNEVYGTLPTQIGLLGNLASLSLASNQMTGSIPVEMGDAPKLQRIWLYGNKLTGTIPNELQQLTKLEVFETHQNKITGAMPEGICTRFNNDVTYEFKELTSDCNSGVECSASCCTKCY